MSKFKKEHYPPLLKEKRTKKESQYIVSAYLTLAYVLNGKLSRKDIEEMANALKEAISADGGIFF